MLGILLFVMNECLETFRLKGKQKVMSALDNNIVITFQGEYIYSLHRKRHLLLCSLFLSF